MEEQFRPQDRSGQPYGAPEQTGAPNAPETRSAAQTHGEPAQPQAQNARGETAAPQQTPGGPGSQEQTAQPPLISPEEARRRAEAQRAAQPPYGAAWSQPGYAPCGAQWNPQYPPRAAQWTQQYPPYGQTWQGGAYAPYGAQWNPQYPPYGAQQAGYAAPGYAPNAPVAPAVRGDRAAVKKRRRGRGGRYAAYALVLLVVFATLCGLAAKLVNGARRGEAASVPSAFDIEPLPEELDGGLSTAEIAQKVAPSVVAIQAYARGLYPISAGSGIIMNGDGYIITNAHVLEGASSAMVMLEDGRELVATIVGADTSTDLAVLRVTADDLVPAEFGDSNTLVVGERAVAIGNAAGYLTGTTTQGCISGLDRSLDFEDADGNFYTLNLIQTDASINPGNSGGALANRYGQVIGINTARLADNEYEGIGFAIPITDAKPVLESLIANGRAPGRPMMGVTVLALTPVTGPANDLPAQGLYIREMTSECSLWAQGVQPGDVLVKANGTVLEQTDDLTQLIADASIGDEIELEVYLAASGETVTVTATLYESFDD